LTLETPKQPVGQHFTRSAGPSGSASSMPPPPPKVSEHPSPMKSKGKEKAQERKRDEDSKAGPHHLSAQSLVQQVTYNVMPIEIMLMCQLSAGVGTGRASQWDHHHPSFWQP